MFTGSTIKQATSKQHMYTYILLIDIQVNFSLIELLHKKLRIPSAVVAYSLLTFDMNCLLVANTGNVSGR